MMDKNLEQENKELKEKLWHAQLWMKKELAWAQRNIIYSHTKKENEILASSSREETILEQIYSFFPPEVLAHFPENGVSHLLSSEIIFYQIISWLHVDGTGVIMWYQKILDMMIESYITKWFRKYIQNNGLKSSPENSPLEKSLFSIIDKNYILSLWRLYQILSNIKGWKNLWRHEQNFKHFIYQKSHLKKSLLESSFLLQLERLMNIHAVWEKRHKWILSKDDTRVSREIFVWNFMRKDCLLYILAESQSSEF